MIIVAHGVDDARKYKAYLTQMKVGFEMWTGGSWVYEGDSIVSIIPSGGFQVRVVALHPSDESAILAIGSWENYARPFDTYLCRIYFHCWEST